MPRTGLNHRKDLSILYSSCRCSSSPTATQEAPIEQPSTSLPSHWEEHLSHLRPGERRALNRYIPLVFKVSALEPTMQQLSDDHLAAYTQQFRARLASGEPLQSLLPKAFAVVREAASRVLGMRHYDVQILGGIVLAQGQVAEMATGEGKTLVAALPAYLYALSGKGVHIVTVNDYLAQRDASWIGKILTFLGLSVGVVTSEASDVQRTEGFAADVTYVTAYELAFTFLQDNLAPSTDAVSLRRPLHYAIVDEVDSILIDEARNPFIMTAPDNSDTTSLTERYWKFSIQVAKLLQGPTSDQLSEDWTDTGGVPSEPLPFDFLPDYRSRIATLTQRGMVHAVRALAMPEIDQILLAQVEEYAHSRSTQGLYVVLMAPTIDGKLELTIRAAAGEAVGAAFSSDKEDLSSLDGRRVVVESRSDVEPTLLSQFKLVSLVGSPSENGVVSNNNFDGAAITDEQWRAAAPAALWTGSDYAWGKYLNQSIRAQHLYFKDIHYILREREVVIVDTSTGRERHRSRWQSGLHQAVEAKEGSEGVEIKSQHYDKGRTTYQSLFNLYTKLCGMTGTAVTEAEEFSEAYNVSVVRVPPHRPSKRIDNSPNVYLGTPGWAKRITEIVRSAAAERRPVLLGTSSVEESEAVLDLVVNIPFETELTDMDVKRLEKALAVLPDSLPPPHYPLSSSVDDDEDNNGINLSPEQQYALQSYLDLMELYEDALFAAKRLRRTRRLTPEIGVDIERGGKLFRALASSNNNGLLLPTELVECMEVSDVLLQVVNRSRLGNVVPINLLNARPDRARKEAQIIAQAGLPGTITVATAMAGRGTDILLGGNPKGLTLIALQYYLLPILAKNADDLTDTLPKAPPLQGLDMGAAFVSEADMKLHLPLALYKAFIQAKEAALEAAKRLNSGSNGGSAAAAAAAMLPGYGSSTTSTGSPTSSVNSKIKAQGVSEVLSNLLESVEVDRSVYLMKVHRENQTPSLEAAFEWTTEQATFESSNTTTTERALRRYALLQWLWFDSQCEKYATLVRAAGGLATIITSIQDTRRTERQLRGRAGRQGDPGETYMISHRNDPAVQSILSPAQMQGLWEMVEAQSSPLDVIDSKLMRVALKTLTTTAEQQGLSARELTRKYDAAIDSYRRHVFRLRRTLAGGGDGARGVLAHRQLRRLAAELVVAYTDEGRKHPMYWQVEELLGSVQKLFGQNDDREDNFNQGGSEGGSSGGDGGGGGDLEAMEIVTSIQQGSSNKNFSSPPNSDFELGFDVEMNVQSSAAELKAALCRNWDLPRPQFLSRGVEDDQENTWMPVRCRVAYLNARSHQINNRNNEQHQIDQGIEDRSSYKGRHAPAVARLQLYMGDLITFLYEKKRRALVASVYQRCNAKSPSGGGGGGGGILTTATSITTPLHVLSMLRLWERNAMLQCIDSLWTDFLQDITTLQRAAMTRAFSQLDPVDEFKLEAAALFARLLRDFRRQSAVALLAPVDIRDMQWGAYSAEEQAEQMTRGRGGENSSIDGALDDVAWLADVMEEERNDAKEEEPPANIESQNIVPDANAGFKTGNSGGSGGDGASPGEVAAIEKLLAQLSQVSSEELGAAIKKLDEKWQKDI